MVSFTIRVIGEGSINERSGSETLLKVRLVRGSVVLDLLFRVETGQLIALILHWILVDLHGHVTDAK